MKGGRVSRGSFSCLSVWYQFGTDSLCTLGPCGSCNLSLPAVEAKRRTECAELETPALSVERSERKERRNAEVDEGGERTKEREINRANTPQSWHCVVEVTNGDRRVRQLNMANADRIL